MVYSIPHWNILYRNNQNEELIYNHVCNNTDESHKMLQEKQTNKSTHNKQFYLYKSTKIANTELCYLK